MKKNLVFGAALAVFSCFLMGCASSHSGSGSREVLMRSTLDVTPEEVARVRAEEEKAHRDLDAIAAANARVQAFDAIRAEHAKKKAGQVREYQEKEAAKIQAYRDAQTAQRRARIAAEQQKLQPLYDALQEEERKKAQEADAVRLRRGLK